MLNSTRGNLEELNVQGLQPGTEYLFRVVANNQHGAGQSSKPLLVRRRPFQTVIDKLFYFTTYYRTFSSSR